MVQKWSYKMFLSSFDIGTKLHDILHYFLEHFLFDYWNQARAAVKMSYCSEQHSEKEAQAVVNKLVHYFKKFLRYV